MNTPFIDHSKVSFFRNWSWLFLCALIPLMEGCRPPEPADKNSNQQSNTIDASLASNTEDQCEKWVDSIISMSQPDQYSVKVEERVVTGLLNDWSSNCGSTKHDLDTEGLKQWLNEEEIERLQSTRFNGKDTDHIRNCILYFNIWESVAAGLETDLERVNKVFEFVITNMALIAEADMVPFSRHNTLLWGVGTAEDRALVFADILRQNRIDTCILTPVSPANENAPWLVGVILKDEVYLYNTQLGIPIPGPEADENQYGISDVATLEEALNDDSILKKLALDDEHPFLLTKEDLSQLNVEMIGYPELWVSRFSRLQTMLPKDNKFLLTDGLVDNESGQGLASRLVAQSKGRWKIEELKIWPFPEKRRQQRLNMPEEQQQIEQSFEGSLRVYFGAQQDDTSDGTGYRITSSNLVHQARLAYLMGQYQQAVKQYVGTQVILKQSSDNDSLTVEQLMQIGKQEEAAQCQLALENISYWLPTAQMALGKYDQAGDLYTEYGRKYGGTGFWTRAAVLNSITSYAQSKKYALAIQVVQQFMEPLPEGSLERYGLELKLKQLRNLQQQERLKQAN
ncbi:MAG: hypothetical protein R3C11_04335 [Planctomycetaceae bacterium]